MKNLNCLNLDVNKLDTNTDLLLPSFSSNRKRAFKKFLFELNEGCPIIQDVHQESRIKDIYSMLVLIDIYCLQIPLDIDSFKRFPVYIYIITRSIRKLHDLNTRIRKTILHIDESKASNVLNKQTLIQYQIHIDHIGVQKIEHLNLIDMYIGYCENCLIDIKEMLYEEHAD